MATMNTMWMHSKIGCERKEKKTYDLSNFHWMRGGTNLIQAHPNYFLYQQSVTYQIYMSCFRSWFSFVVVFATQRCTLRVPRTEICVVLSTIAGGDQAGLLGWVKSGEVLL